MPINFGPRQLLGKKSIVNRWHFDLLHPATNITNKMMVMVGITTNLNLHPFSSLSGFNDPQAFKIFQVPIYSTMAKSRIIFPQALITIPEIYVMIRMLS